VASACLQGHNKHFSSFRACYSYAGVTSLGTTNMRWLPIRRLVHACCAAAHNLCAHLRLVGWWPVSYHRTQPCNAAI
jgi:hypothetical protein